MRTMAALSAAVVMLGAGLPALGQERLHIEGSPYSLVVPPGFAVSTRYVGYENADATVIIRFAPVGPAEGGDDPYTEAKKILEDAYLATVILGGHGINYDRIETFAAGDGSPLFGAHGYDGQPDGTMAKRWTVLAGPEVPSFVLIDMSEAEEMTDDEIRSLLATLELKQD
jgi:hypothetical protein